MENKPTPRRTGSSPAQGQTTSTNTNMTLRAQSEPAPVLHTRWGRFPPLVAVPIPPVPATSSSSVPSSSSSSSSSSRKRAKRSKYERLHAVPPLGDIHVEGSGVECVDDGDLSEVPETPLAAEEPHSGSTELQSSASDDTLERKLRAAVGQTHVGFADAYAMAAIGPLTNATHPRDPSRTAGMRVVDGFTDGLEAYIWQLRRFRTDMDLQVVSPQGYAIAITSQMHESFVRKHVSPHPSDLEVYPNPPPLEGAVLADEGVLRGKERCWPTFAVQREMGDDGLMNYDKFVEGLPTLVPVPIYRVEKPGFGSTRYPTPPGLDSLSPTARVTRVQRISNHCEVRVHRHEVIDASLVKFVLCVPWTHVSYMSSLAVEPWVKSCLNIPSCLVNLGIEANNVVVDPYTTKFGDVFSKAVLDQGVLVPPARTGADMVWDDLFRKSLSNSKWREAVDAIGRMMLGEAYKPLPTDDGQPEHALPEFARVLRDLCYFPHANECQPDVVHLHDVYERMMECDMIPPCLRIVISVPHHLVCMFTARHFLQSLGVKERDPEEPFEYGLRRSYRHPFKFAPSPSFTSFRR